MKYGKITVLEGQHRQDTVITTSAGTALLCRAFEYICEDFATDRKEQLRLILPTESFIVIWQDLEEFRSAIDQQMCPAIRGVPPRPNLIDGKKQEVLRVVLNAAHGADCRLVLSDNTDLIVFWPISIVFNPFGTLEIFLAKESFTYRGRSPLMFNLGGRGGEI